MTEGVKIELERWIGPHGERVKLSESTPQSLRVGLAKLDGRKTDSCWITIEEAGILMVGGGPAGYVVYSFRLDG